MTTHIIPDIHGQYDKLIAALNNLGFVFKNAHWSHPMGDTALFLGDYIDRGPENIKVMRTVRQMVDDGIAQAIMGNHELNALHYHGRNPQNGQPMRAHSANNTKQHESFLKECPLGSPQAKEWLHWMAGLPLFIEGPFRAVHACWDQMYIDVLNAHGPLDIETIVHAGDNKHPLFKALEITTKGPERPLPFGYSFQDSGGYRRKKTRVKWWPTTSKSWTDVAISVPNPAQLPQKTVDDDFYVYPENAPKVFFGHYWLTLPLEIEAPNALCLDHSAGRDGPLVTYALNDPSDPLTLSRFRVH